MHYFGAGRDLQEAGTPVIHHSKVNKRKFAFIPLAEGEFSAAGNFSAGASVTNAIDDYYRIKNAKSQNEIVIVIYHGGNEYYSLPSPDLQKKCRFFVEAGADAIVCHHTHVVSGYEVYKSKPIFYGLGNFFFDLPGKISEEWHTGMLLSLDFEDQSISYQLHPVLHSWDNVSLEILDSMDKENVLADIQNKSLTIADPLRLSESWNAFCEEKERQYMSFYFGLNLIERFLLKKGIKPFWKINNQRFLRLLGVIACDAHREVMEYILWKYVRK
jgi:poly-gamma-glutamate synthesis protein (capsule biosynthesis protein)